MGPSFKIIRDRIVDQSEEKQVSKYDGKSKTPTHNIPATRVTVKDWDNYITTTRGQSLGPNILVRLIYMLISFYFYLYSKEHSAFKR